MEQQDRSVQLVLNSWKVQVKRAGSLFEKLTNEQLAKEVSPGRNTGIYLLGHLIASNDSLFPIFGAHDNLYPGMDEVFVKAPDKSGQEMADAGELRRRWKEVHEKLEVYFQTLSDEDWFSRHRMVSEEDFLKEPHRNKLNVLISRTTHMAYHLGQVALLNQ